MSVFRITLTALALAALPAGAAQEGDRVELKMQTRCPVMGGVIDSTAFTDIQGQRVYHCCAGCSKMLEADPDKYFKKAAADSVLFENIQVACPVSGEPLEEKSVYADYEGRRVFFCCENCVGSFAEDPHKYLKRLDEMPEDPAKAEAMGGCPHHEPERSH